MVIESADYALEISAAEWRMTPAEEAQRAKQAAQGMNDFMRRLGDAVERQQRRKKDPKQRGDEQD